MRLAILLVAGVLLAGLPLTGLAQVEAEKLVTIHATQTPLIEVLDILSEKSGLNIVASSAVEGKQVSIRLMNTPVEEALNLVVRAAGLGYERIGNSILVAETDVLGQETGLSTYVIDLEFADAEELAGVLINVGQSVTADIRGNRLVVVATPQIIEQIRKTVGEVDKPPLQIILETEVIEVVTDDLLELGIDWGSIMKQSVVLTETQPSPVEPGAFPSELPFVDLDSPLKDNVFRQAKTLEVALDFLETNGKANILSRSKLATLNNRKAEIHIGDVVPYTVSGLTTGGVIEVSVERERVGVSVSVTPRASGGGYVTAIVEPNVSSIVGWVGPNDEIPWTKERRATTQVRVKDGETFMIAGLLSEDRTETVEKVPLLGDIPLLGYLLFRHTKLETKHSDLIIKITPTIIW